MGKLIVNDYTHMSGVQLAEIYRVTPQCVYGWSGRDGCPRNPDGTYHFIHVNDWYFERKGMRRCPCCGDCFYPHELKPMTYRPEKPKRKAKP